MELTDEQKKAASEAWVDSYPYRTTMPDTVLRAHEKAIEAVYARGWADAREAAATVAAEHALTTDGPDYMTCQGCGEHIASAIRAMNHTDSGRGDGT